MFAGRVIPRDQPAFRFMSQWNSSFVRDSRCLFIPLFISVCHGRTQGMKDSAARTEENREFLKFSGGYFLGIGPSFLSRSTMSISRSAKFYTVFVLKENRRARSMEFLYCSSKKFSIFPVSRFSFVDFFQFFSLFESDWQIVGFYVWNR